MQSSLSRSSNNDNFWLLKKTPKKTPKTSKTLQKRPTVTLPTVKEGIEFNNPVYVLINVAICFYWKSKVTFAVMPMSFCLTNLSLRYP